MIHIFEPLRTQSPACPEPVEGSLRACVRIEPGSLPASDSVSPKHPIASPAAIRGSHSSFCASLPHRWIAYIASDPCTLTKLRMPESTASSSRQATPYAVALVPAQP